MGLEGILGDDEFTEKVNDSYEGQGGDSEFYKMIVGKNYVGFYPDKNGHAQVAGAYVHYIGREAFRCVGSDKDKSYDPDHCPLCAEAARFYELKKKAKTKVEKDGLNDKGWEISSKLQMYILIIPGEGMREKVTDPKTGEVKKITTIDFENPQVKILRLSEAQWWKVGGFKGNDHKKAVKGLKESFPDIFKTKEDFCNRAIVFIKPQDKFGEVEVIPGRAKVVFPKVEGEIPNIKEAEPDCDVEAMKNALADGDEGGGEDSVGDLGKKESKTEPMEKPAEQVRTTTAERKKNRDDVDDDPLSPDDEGDDEIPF